VSIVVVKEIPWPVAQHKLFKEYSFISDFCLSRLDYDWREALHIPFAVQYTQFQLLHNPITGPVLWLHMAMAAFYVICWFIFAGSHFEIN
jgi:hypothetical protein